MAKCIIDPYYIEEDSFFAMDLAQMAKARNHMAWQFQLIEPYLGRLILEIGVGIGNFTALLAGGADQVTSSEPNQHCYEKLVVSSYPSLRALSQWCHFRSVSPFL